MEAAHHVERQVLFTWGEARDEPVTFTPGCVHVMGISKADDAGTPHFRLGPGGLFHHIQDLVAVGTLFLVCDALEKFIHACFGWDGFQFSHDVLLLIIMNARSRKNYSIANGPNKNSHAIV